MRKTIEVFLDQYEAIQAAEVAILRRFENLYGNKPDYHNLQRENDTWDLDINSAMCELAFAKAFGVYWSGAGLKGQRDVGNFEVRSTKYKTGKLILHPKDDDEAPFALVVENFPQFTIVGWTYGHLGKNQAFWQDPTKKNRPAYFVPQESLFDF